MATKPVFLIRVALITGVAVFAVLVAVQRSQGQAPLAGGTVSMATLRYTLWALAAFATAGALFIRTRMQSAPPTRRGGYLVIGWALGESVALLGTVLYYLGAELSTMAIGLITFACVLLLLPIARERA